MSNLTLEAARKQITTALSDYFNRLAPGEVAVRTQLGALISEVVGVVDYQLLAPRANVVPVVNKQTVQWNAQAPSQWRKCHEQPRLRAAAQCPAATEKLCAYR
ncbi:MAG: hypothetical protein ACR5LG_03115 [Sodalis sp. (in: enterobacteria)]|uniref:hypothetical protein n=1 Tax=Sodalis sp. (in: enterobacteria) TaxID=1898979 RepID=UPI003F2AF38F